MIRLKNDREIEGIRNSGKLLAKLLNDLNGFIKSGITTKDIDDYCVEFLKENNAKAACLNYEGYPNATCVSVNDELIHGIPRRKHYINDGDIVSVDLCLDKDGFISDSARTYLVGKVSPEVEDLVKVTEECLYKGIKAAAQKGARILDIGLAVSRHAERHGYSVVRDYTGHGVGFEVHEDPAVPNYVSRSFANPRITKGMVFAIEPMINMGSHAVYVLDDDWTVVTSDGSLCAHFEHTVAMTSKGLEIMTKL